MFLIPESLVYLSMFYLSFMGVICARRKILFNPIYFLSFIPQALIYLYFDLLDIPFVERAPYVRLSLFLLSLLFSAVLTWQWSRKNAWMKTLGLN